jgi:hypothetical protein
MLRLLRGTHGLAAAFGEVGNNCNGSGRGDGYSYSGSGYGYSSYDDGRGYGNGSGYGYSSYDDGRGYGAVCSDGGFDAETA